MVGSDGAATALLIDRVRALLADTPAEEIAVLASHRARVRRFAEALAGAGIDHIILDADKSGPGVRVATMHRVKGLDFTHVVMHMSDDTRASRDPRDQSLLYVAATRCRKTLTVLAEPSSLERNPPEPARRPTDGRR